MEVDVDRHGCPAGQHAEHRQEAPDMTDHPATRRTIEVDADVYDVLARTAASRGTDVNGALRYLIEVPTPRTVVDNDED
ncbi:hypothetical protein [Micromonospora rifamycinica]|nr:hypothetical protein [Micromonospora rifamycinica]KWV33314.1 hypothetical protein AWV63_07580 [Micromonospora rifamycinica]